MRLIRAAQVEQKALGARGRSARLLPPESGYRPLELYLNELDPRSGPGPYHYHSNADNIYVVIAGTAAVTVGETRVAMDPGDVIVLAAGERHDIENDGAESLRVLEIKAPAGSDFVLTEGERPRIVS